MIDLAALRPFLDDHAYPIAVDWLQEHGATLADLLLAYRGEPPGYLGRSFEADEGLRRLLGEWCKATEPERTAQRPFPLLGVATPFRWQAVLACEVDWVEVAGEVGFGLEHRVRAMSLADRQKLARLMVERIAEKGIVDRVRVANDPLLAAGVAGADAAFQERARTAAASARRGQKCRALGLFPEVSHTWEARISALRIKTLYGTQRHVRDAVSFELLYDDLFRAGFAVSIGGQAKDLVVRQLYKENLCLITQTLAAPDWIPPER